MCVCFLNCKSLGSGTQHLLNFIWKSVPGHLIWAPTPPDSSPFSGLAVTGAKIPSAVLSQLDLGVSVTCSQKHLLHFINRSISCWKWKWVILFSGSRNLYSQQTWRKGNNYWTPAMCQAQMQGVCTDIFFVNPGGGHHHTSSPVPAAVSDVGAVTPGDHVSHACWREAGRDCLWAVQGVLPGSGHMASWKWCCFQCLCDKDWSHFCPW